MGGGRGGLSLQPPLSHTQPPPSPGPPRSGPPVPLLSLPSHPSSHTGLPDDALCRTGFLRCTGPPAPLHPTRPAALRLARAPYPSPARSPQLPPPLPSPQLPAMAAAAAAAAVVVAGHWRRRQRRRRRRRRRRRHCRGSCRCTPSRGHYLALARSTLTSHPSIPRLIPFRLRPTFASPGQARLSSPNSDTGPPPPRRRTLDVPPSVSKRRFIACSP